MNKREFFDRPATCYFCDDAKAVARYCQEQWPEDVKHIIRVADEVSRNYFLFDLKWDMERTYEPVDFGDGPIQWDINPKGDPEFIWQFNRHRFFICLGQAYQLTGDEKYTETFIRLLKDWIEHVIRKPENQMKEWRSLETGLRGEYWTKAFYLFKESPLLTDEVVAMFYQSMMEHAEYLLEVHSPYRYISNWGVLENHGLFDIGLMLPQSERTREFVKIALERLTIEAKMQVMDDGVHWEQSPMYHNEVYQCFMDVLILAPRNGIVVPTELKTAVHQMALANLAWKKPNHHQFMMGDSDDTDIRDMITKGAYLFKDGILKFGGYQQLDFETVWDLGIGAVDDYKAIAIEEPDFTSVALADSGNYYLRSDWSETANLLHFHCGTLGAGHGHSDKLHVDLVLAGEDVLVDAGRYTYVAGVDRFAFKDPMAHNTLTVDDKLFTICKDSWECSKLAQPIKQQFVIKDDYAFLQGGHLGYMDLESGVFVNRKIIYIKPDIYILADEFYTGGSHCYQQYFHFNNYGSITIEADSKHRNKAIYHGQNIDAEVYFLSSDIQIEKITTNISRNYNLKEENETIKVSFAKEGFASAITVISGAEQGEKSDLIVEKVPVSSVLKEMNYPDSMAEGLKICSGQKTYVVIICHQEVNSPTDLVAADGCMGFGNVIVFDKEKSILTGTVLNW